MKSIPAAITTHIAGDLTTLATCWVLTRTDGVAYYFTDHDADISITDTSNGVDGTYESSTGYTASSISSNLDLAVDNLDINGLMASSSINEADIVAGLYDNAEVKIFMVNWQSPDDGIVKLRRGWLGELELRDQIYVAEMRGMAQAMQQPNGRTFGPDCDAQIGDDRCKVRTDPPEWAATTVYTERLDKDAGTGSVVKPSSENGRHFKCSTPGTSGVSEPSWDTTIGNTTNDGTVVWTTIRALTVTGVVTLTADSSKTITGITQANPGVVTATAHGFSNGDEIYLSGIGGMTEMNGTVQTITNVTTDTFEIVDTTTYTAYTSGGTADKHVQTSETLTWTGEFDTPARFDTDQFRAEFLYYRDSDKEAVFNLQSLSVVGLKL